MDQDIKQVQDNEEKSISNGVDFDSDDNIDVQDPVVYSHIEDPVVFANEDSNNDFQESKFDEAVRSLKGNLPCVKLFVKKIYFTLWFFFVCGGYIVLS